MKYIKYLTIPALAIMASCGGTQDGALSNAELDAKVAAKVKAATEQLATDCDARIAQTAQMKADSILAHAKAPVVHTAAPEHKNVVVAPVPAHHDKPVHHDKPKVEVPKEGNHGKVSEHVNDAVNHGKADAKKADGTDAIVPVNHGKKQ